MASINGKHHIHQRPAFSPYLFAIIMDSLTEEVAWQIMFADGVVLWARETHVLELEPDHWRKAFEKRGMKVSRAKTEYNSMCLNGTPLGSVN